MQAKEFIDAVEIGFIAGNITTVVLCFVAAVLIVVNPNALAYFLYLTTFLF